MKKAFLTLLALVVAMTTMAERVSEQDAAQVAQNFMSAQKQQTELKKLSGKKPTVKRVALQEEQQFYVYEYESGGWVMIAANDVAHPILAYSDSGSFSTEGMPKNMRWWFGKYSKCIEAAEADNAVATEEVQAEWRALRKGTASTQASAVVGPLVQTTWDQDAPYYNLCPGTGSNKAYTGCVATAMAQVMNYWQWPKQGTGSHSYRPRDPNNENNYSSRYTSTLSADFGATTYDWDNMLDHYNYYYNASGQKVTCSAGTTAQQTAVATLMYHCGVATEMMYGNDADGGSGTYTTNYGSWSESDNAQNALYKYFGYKQPTGYMRDGLTYNGTKYYDSWSDAAWTTMIKEELDLQHPIMYGGAGDEGGHSFICDGYNTDNYFHFNWGWSGQNDGYFTLNNLVPGSGGAGGGGYNFSEDQDVLIGIEPDKPLADDETTLSYKLTGVIRLTGTAPGIVKKTEAITATFSAQNGYQALTTDNTTISVTIGDVAGNYTTLADGVITLTIPADKVTDAVTVTIKATTDTSGETEVKVLDTAVGYYYTYDGSNYWDVDLWNYDNDYPEVYISIPATGGTGINGSYKALYTWYGWSSNDSIEGDNGTFTFEYLGESDYDGWYLYHVTGHWVADNNITYFYDANVDLKLVDYDNGNATIEPTGDIDGGGESGGGDIAGDYYEKVTSTAQLTEGQYLIVYEDEEVAFDGGLETLDGVENSINVSISSNKIAATTATIAAEFTLAKSGSNWTILSKSGYYIGRTTDKNGLNTSDTEIYTNTISISSGDAVITGTGGPSLQFNSASDQMRFRYYKSTQQAIQLYKKAGNGEGGGNEETAEPVTLTPNYAEADYYSDYSEEGAYNWTIYLGEFTSNSDYDWLMGIDLTTPTQDAIAGEHDSNTDISTDYSFLEFVSGIDTTVVLAESVEMTLVYKTIDAEGYPTYSIDITFSGDDNNTYIIKTDLTIYAIDVETDEEIDLSGDTGITAVENILQDISIQAVYDIQGRVWGKSVIGLPTGLYIIKTEQGTHKIMVK